MELGNLQKEWIKSLREHPERQISGTLGRKHDDDYLACCLGELLMTAYRFNYIDNPFGDKHYNDTCLVNGGNTGTIERDYDEFGLYSCAGTFKNGQQINIKNNGYISLAGMNDSENMTWLEIADFIEQNPEIVFSKSI